MLAPYLTGLILLYLLPALLAIGVAFTDFDALSPPRWIGFGNFRRMLQDPDFWNGLRASLVFVALAVPLRVGGALGLALLLYRQAPGVTLARTAVYLPTVVPDVAYALLWLHIFNPLYGPLNGLAWPFTGWFDTTPAVRVGPTGWLLDPVAAQVAIVLMLAWTIGEGFVLLMAALQDIPRELYESAAIDGAGSWQRFTLLTLPLLAPFLLLLALRSTVWSFQANFVAAVIVTRGGPYYATSYLPYWVYLNAADYQRFGYAAAMIVVMLLITGSIIVLQVEMSRRWRAAHFG
jgi:multiple sugar transport system permease protein